MLPAQTMISQKQYAKSSSGDICLKPKSSVTLKQVHAQVQHNIAEYTKGEIDTTSLVNISPDKIKNTQFIRYLNEMPFSVKVNYSDELNKYIETGITKKQITFGMPIFKGLFTPQVLNNVESEIFKVYLNGKAKSFGPGRVCYTETGIKLAPAKDNGLNISEEPQSINYGLFTIDGDNNIALSAGATIVYKDEIDIGGGEISKFDDGIWKITKVFAIKPGSGAGTKVMQSLNKFIPESFPSQKAACLHSRFCFLPKELHNGVNNDRTDFYSRERNQGIGKEYIMLGVPYIEYEGNKENGAIPNWWMFNKDGLPQLKNDEQAFRNYTKEMSKLRNQTIKLLRKKGGENEFRIIFSKMAQLAEYAGISKGYINVEGIIEEYVQNGLITRNHNDHEINSFQILFS